MTAPRRSRRQLAGPVRATGVGLRIAGCPEPGCTAPAEVSDEVSLTSTDGPVRLARTRCLHHHVFLLPVSYIPGWQP